MRSFALSTFVLLLAACAGTSAAVQPQPAPAAVQEPATDAARAGKTAADERAAREKELQQKQRELEYAEIEGETQAIEREARRLGVQAAVAKAEETLAEARAAREAFLGQEKPRQLEQRRIQLDQQTYAAEEAKDELGELEAMYAQDEFARSTKELVLKRGRRKLELSERSLAIGRQEIDFLREHTLPQQEREHQRKVADAELELQKARLELKKADLELALGARKAKDRVADLQRDIAELQQKLAAKDR